MKKSSFVWAVGLGLAGSAIVATPARAALVLDIFGVTTVTDNGVGDSDPTVGRIVNNSVVAGFGINIAVANSNSPGTSTLGSLSVTSLTISNQNASPSSIWVNVSDTDFAIPGIAGTPMTLGSAFSGNFDGTTSPGDTATFKSAADPANAQPATAVVTPLLTFTKSLPFATAEAFSGSNGATFVHGAGAYSLSNRAIVNLAAGGSVSLSGTTTATPEPASLGLLGGLAGLVLARRRSAR